MSEAELKKLVDNKHSVREISAITGLSYSTIRYYLKKFGFKTVFDKANDWDIEKLREISKTATSRRQILAELGRRDTGSVYVTLAKIAERNGITLPDYDRKKMSAQPKSIEDMFKLDSRAGNQTLRKYMISHFNIEAACKFCSLSEWRGAPLSLEIDHIDGNHQNNAIENLRFLCPNCHSQTETYSRRKK